MQDGSVKDCVMPEGSQLSSQLPEAVCAHLCEISLLYQGGLQHFVIGGGKNCMDMDTCSMHVHPTCLKKK